MQANQDNLSTQLPNIIEAHFKAEADKYNQYTNPNGYVNFGVSVNGLNMDNIIHYFPKYITKADCQYKFAPEELNLNQILCEGTPYNANQTFALGSLLTLIAVHAQHWHLVSVQGNYLSIGAVQSYSACKIVPFQQSECHIVFYPSKQTVESYLKMEINKKILIVVSDPKEVIQTDRKDVFYGFQKRFKFGMTCGVGLYKDKSIPSQLEDFFVILQLSEFLSATIKHSQKEGLSNSQLQELSQIQSQQNYHQSFMRLLENPVDLPHLHLTNGTGISLSALGHSLFNKGDLVALDKPYYARFIEDFHKAGVTYQFLDLFTGTLLTRAQQAFNKGAKGYIICNPHNPTGIIYSREQIQELCEWAQDHLNFHIILDEMYHHSIHSNDKELCNTVYYANKYPNIHVLRGFAKDFSLCGFKVGYMVSSNPKVRHNFTEWSQIIRPHELVLKALSRMLRMSDYGKSIFVQAKKTLSKAFKITLNLLDQCKIKYIKPEGGCFLMIDLRAVLEKTGLTQRQLWKKLFFEAKINANRGTLYGFQEGFFRICPVVEDPLIHQGIRRISLLINTLSASPKTT